jgi:hypothetical protein
MSDTKPARPSRQQAATPESTEGQYQFDQDRDLQGKDEAQAEASQYGIYGYADESGAEVENQPEYDESESSEAAAKAHHEAKRQGVEQPSKGGQEWHESEHGTGFAQPMQQPQRSAAHSSRPAKPDGSKQAPGDE